MKRWINGIVYIFAFIGFSMILIFVAVETGLTNSKGIIDKQHDYFKNQNPAVNQTTEAWQTSEEWLILKDAIKKDKETIDRVSDETGIPSRIIVTPLVVEQLRLFNSEREIFKMVFAPLKILGNQSQFSWGVMGIKQDTAREIESNLKDPQSIWYLGKNIENILDFKTDNPDNERFERLTDEHNRYYSYLYGALFIKQIEKQWSDAGYPIDNRPGIIATLFNIGFKNSKPHNSPLVGGAEIEINKTTYSFGGLALSFYNSDELNDVFPR